jgi:hypothetical protein
MRGFFMAEDIKDWQERARREGNDALFSLLERIAEALERMAPPAAAPVSPAAAEAFIWNGAAGVLDPVAQVNRQPLSLLVGIDAQRDRLLENTRRFAEGLPANNALLWGARGMGKSSLVKAVHGALVAHYPQLRLVEIHREEIETLPGLMRLIRAHGRFRFIVFCDDLSFDAGDSSYKSLKAALEGGIEGRPANMVFYATSNRRHLLPREMIENERASAVNPSDAMQEKISLSDRFGLWLGFHPCDQDTYLAMVEAYARHFGLAISREALRREALEWAAGRGARSGRVAWQFIQDLAGRLGKALA